MTLEKVLETAERIDADIDTMVRHDDASGPVVHSRIQGAPLGRPNWPNVAGRRGAPRGFRLSWSVAQLGKVRAIQRAYRERLGGAPFRLNLPRWPAAGAYVFDGPPRVTWQSSNTARVEVRLLDAFTNQT